jgi:hypothetical protein
MIDECKKYDSIEVVADDADVIFRGDLSGHSADAYHTASQGEAAHAAAGM